MTIDKDKTKRLYRRIADELISGIRSGQFKIGDKLPGERDLAETMSASRPVIREAIIALEILGIIEVRHGSGVYVIGLGNANPTTLAQEDLNVGAFELIEARMVVEGETAAIAANVVAADDIARLDELVLQMSAPDQAVAERADFDFHLAIARITENGPLISIVDQLWELRATSPLASAIMSRAKGGGLTARISEHRAIVDALRCKDATAARSAMREHLVRVREYVLEATETAEIATLRKQRNATQASWAKRTRA